MNDQHNLPNRWNRTILRAFDACDHPDSTMKPIFVCSIDGNEIDIRLKDKGVDETYCYGRCLVCHLKLIYRERLGEDRGILEIDRYHFVSTYDHSFGASFYGRPKLCDEVDRLNVTRVVFSRCDFYKFARALTLDATEALNRALNTARKHTETVSLGRMKQKVEELQTLGFAEDVYIAAPAFARKIGFFEWGVGATAHFFEARKH